MKDLTRVLKYLRSYKSAVGLYVLFTLLSQLFSIVSFGMLVPVLNLLFLDNAAAAANFSGKGTSAIDRGMAYVVKLAGSTDKLTILAAVCCVLVVFVILKNVFLYLSKVVLFPVRHGVTRRLRNDMFEKVLSLPIGYFTEERRGDLVSRMSNDVNMVQESVMSVMEVFIQEPITIMYYLAAMILISAKLSLFMLIILPVAGLMIGRVGSSLRRSARRMSQQMSDITSVLDETLGGMRVVKAFNVERTQYLRFLKLNNQNFRERNRIAQKQELASPLSETLGVLIVALILWFGGRLVMNHDQALPPASFLLYITLFSQIISPIKNLTSAINSVQKGSVALARMEEILQVENTVKESENPLRIGEFKSSIELRGVHFAYGEKKILNGIDLIIQKGKTVALVGSSGAGKSTLADLIPRFHDVTAGEILIDGINIKELKIEDVRRLMGVVSQEPILFNDTIAANITLGTGGATQEQIVEAATVAHSEKFIAAKPEGYDTVVGDRGTRLSGGERQRVTIARAVLKNPPILILDEATSSLDTESERIVQEAINNLMKDRTCIVIAHRLSTVRHADEIIVLERGRIAERGTHHDLLQQGGLYQKLVAMQQVR